MVRIEDIVKFEKLEAPQLRLFCIALETENNILKAQLQSLRDERNKLMKKVSDITLDSNAPNNVGVKPLGNLPR